MDDRILTEDDVEQFKNDGYIAPIPVLTSEEIADLRTAIDEHLAGSLRSERYELTDEIRIRNTAPESEPPAYEYDTDPHDKVDLHTFAFLFNLWKVDRRFARIAHHKKIVRIARQLLGVGQVMLFEDNAVIKTPFSKYLPWHQDYSYWPLGEPAALTVWIAIDDIDASNGAMEIAPGTQRLGERLPVAFGNGLPFMQEERPGIPAIPSDPRSQGHEIHTYKLRAGECGVHDALVWHGSTPNSTAQLRRAFVLRYVATGALWLGNSRMAYEDVGCPVGGRLTPEHFPLAGEV